MNKDMKIELPIKTYDLPNGGVAYEVPDAILYMSKRDLQLALCQVLNRMCQLEEGIDRACHFLDWLYNVAYKIDPINLPDGNLHNKVYRHEKIGVEDWKEWCMSSD